MSSVSSALGAWGIDAVWVYIALFLATSLVMLWRLDALLKHGLEGTALGTLVMPYCSGLGNLLFVAIVARQPGQGGQVLTNCLVNNVTNLTAVLALPALFWGLQMRPPATARPRSRNKNAAAATTLVLSRLSVLLTLAAVVFFSGVAWALSRDGTLDRSDGLVLVGLFLFWQCFQVFDVLRQNARQRRGFSAWFYIEVGIVIAAGYGQYISLDWLVTWLAGQSGSFINPAHLGWLSGWLMVLPNAIMAIYYGAKRRADIAYASQIGDGHICIPLCLGLSALVAPIAVPAFFQTGLLLLIAAAVGHATCLLASGGLPRWMGWPLLGAYAWFVGAGLAGG